MIHDGAAIVIQGAMGMAGELVEGRDVIAILTPKSLVET